MRNKLMIVGAVLAVMTTVSVVSAEREVLETILVRVNDRIVTVNDFKGRLRQELAQFSPVPQGKDLRAYTEGLFQTMVDEMLTLERAEDRRIKVDEQAVDNAIDGLREQNDLDVVFEVDLHYEVLLLFDEHAPPHRPVIVDAGGVVHRRALHLVADLG